RRERRAASSGSRRTEYRAGCGLLLRGGAPAAARSAVGSGSATSRGRTWIRRCSRSSFRRCDQRLLASSCRGTTPGNSRLRQTSSFSPRLRRLLLVVVVDFLEVGVDHVLVLRSTGIAARGAGIVAAARLA